MTIRRFHPETCFAINHDLNIQLVELDQGRVLLVDDFYARPDAVRQLVLDAPAPYWKATPEGKNGCHYHDARHHWQMEDGFLQAQQAIAVLARRYLDTDVLEPIRIFNSNHFQLIESQPADSVPVPHEDGHALAALVCLNTREESHGGTAFYSNRFNGAMDVGRLTDLEREALYEWMDNNGLFETGDDYFLHDWQRYWALNYVAEMRFNRLIMYRGTLFHGAYHVDSHFRDHPRINHMMFYDQVRFHDHG